MSGGNRHGVEPATADIERRNTMKSRISMLLALVIAVVVGITGCAQGSVSANAVAVVDGTEIALETFNKNLKMIERSYNKLYGETIWTQEIQGKTVKQIVREEILNNLVNETIIINYVKGTNFTPDQKEVDDAFKQYQESLKADPDTQKFFEENKIDEAFIKKEIEAQLYNEEFKRLIGDEISKDTAKMDELYKTYIVQVSARHILVDDEAAAKKVLERIKAGEDFAKIAKEVSKDPGSAENGGSLGYFNRGMMVPEFEKVAFDLPTGQVSDLVKSKFGYHIIKVDDRKTLVDVEKSGAKKEQVDALKQSIIENLTDDAYTNKLKELTDKYGSKIKKFEDRIK